jgi:SAM-dependent methyltransferase
MHDSSYLHMKYFIEKYIKNLENIQILDVGSQDVNGSYRNLFDHKSWKYTGLDISRGNNVDVVVGNIYDWKEINSNNFDVVISGQALEHIKYPWITLCEIRRVLKYNGLCCIIAPSSGPEHKYPIDCYRFFPDGLAAIADYAGLTIIEAFSYWEYNDRYEEGNVWKDTVLVCKKSNLGLFAGVRSEIKNYISKKVLSL